MLKQNPAHAFLEASLLQFQLLTGEGAQDVKNEAVFSGGVGKEVLKAVLQHGLFLLFNFAISIIMIDLVVATFLEYRGTSA